MSVMNFIPFVFKCVCILQIFMWCVLEVQTVPLLLSGDKKFAWDMSVVTVLTSINDVNRALVLEEWEVLDHPIPNGGPMTCVASN